MAITGVTTFLWFDDQAGEAADFYVGLFPDSRIISVEYYRDGMHKPAGTVLTVDFELFGQPFSALNAGPEFPHSPAVSFQVYCDTQEEIDRVWDALVSNGGRERMCGWCVDRFGVSWQVMPQLLRDLLKGKDDAAIQRAFAAMSEMTRIDLAAILA
jgi:predicted 3-demethylubiquinone-9 3-methyltransferase (glyoxalase superfamily)